MKNLKKSLALVLAIVMVFSLVVFANASFTDEDQISPKFADACGIMNGLGILKGDQNGNFNPQGNLTRGQAMKIITYLKLGSAAADNLKATGAPFNDVPVTAWEAPFVAYCKNAGITAGYGDGNFGKDDALSGYAFAKFLLASIGYNANKEYEGDQWKIAVASDALAQGLFKGIEGYLSDEPLPREVAAQLAVNAALLQPVQYIKLLEMYQPMGNPLYVSPLDFDPEPVTSGTDAEGRPVKDYVALSNPAKVIYEAAAEPIAVITDGSFNAAKFATQKKWDYSKLSGAVCLINTDDGFSNTAYEGEVGMVVEFFGYADKTGKVFITNVVGTAYSFYTVANVDTTKKEVTLNEDGDPAYPWTIKEADYPESYKILSAFAKGDALYVTENWGTGEAILAAEKATAITGTKITAKTAADFTLDGTKYTVSSIYGGPAIALGAVDGTYYADNNGYVIGYVGNVAEEVHNYVYAVKEFSKNTVITDEYGSTTVTTYYVQTVNEAGEVVNYQTADNTYGGFTGKYVYEITTAYDATLKAEVATFDSSGNVTSLTAETLTAKSVKTSGNDYFTDDIKFIFVDKELGAIKVAVKNGVQAITAMDIYYAYVNLGSGNYKTSCIFVDGAAPIPPAPVTGIAFIANDKASTSTALVTNGLGKEVTGYAKSIYVDGVKKDVYLASGAAIADGFYTTKADGELTVLTATTDATLIPATAVTNNAMGYISVSGHEDLAYAGATVVNLTMNPDFANAAKLTTSNTVALVLDSKGALSIIYVVA